MTSDAKIGLLLGLAFIFIIAFVINGLPKFRHKANNNELTTNMTTFDNGQLGIGTKERKTQEALNQMEQAEKSQFENVQVPADGNDIRSTTPLPMSPSTAEEPNNGIETTPQIAGDIPSSPVGVQETLIKKQQQTKPAWPKEYVVSSGDSLAGIAKKLYGSVEGNRRINIDRIFEANRRLLKTPDEISVGQKLIIPPPSNLTQNKEQMNRIFPSTLFDEVKSIGKSTLSKSLDSRGTKQNKSYVVRQGDSLWKIAAEQLGNGSRYTELKELNADILDNEDSLIAGMPLKMPAQ